VYTVAFISGSWSFFDCIAKLELGNEFRETSLRKKPEE